MRGSEVILVREVVGELQKKSFGHSLRVGEGDRSWDNGGSTRDKGIGLEVSARYSL